MIAGGRPFDVTAAKSLRLGDFIECETKVLMKQHADETGQGFSPEAEEAGRTQTQGQPGAGTPYRRGALNVALPRLGCFPAHVPRSAVCRRRQVP